MSGEMNADDSRKINGYYAIISNLERIGDHATNIAEYADDMKKWELQFSDNVLDELEQMIGVINTLRNRCRGSKKVNASLRAVLYSQKCSRILKEWVTTRSILPSSTKRWADGE